MLLILKISLGFLLLIICTSSRATNSLELILILLLLSLDEWGNLRDHIWRGEIRIDLTRCCRRALPSTLWNETTATMALCTHYRHTCMLIHCWLWVRLKLIRETYTWRTTFTNASEIWSDSFVADQILMRNITKLSMMLLITKVAIVEFLFQRCLPLA